MKKVVHCLMKATTLRVSKQCCLYDGQRRESKIDKVIFYLKILKFNF